jgi:DNA-binding response OmpR family regulator
MSVDERHDMLAVFIVENETPLLRLLGWALLEEGLKVARATSLREALDRLAGAEVEALIVNATLAEDDLRSWIGELRAAAPGTRIVALRPPGVRHAGADAYVDPPYRVDELLWSIGQQT